MVRKITKRTHLEEPGVKGTVILKWMLANEGMGWIYLLSTCVQCKLSWTRYLMSFQVAWKQVVISPAETVKLTQKGTLYLEVNIAKRTKTLNSITCTFSAIGWWPHLCVRDTRITSWVNTDVMANSWGLTETAAWFGGNWMSCSTLQLCVSHQKLCQWASVYGSVVLWFACDS